MLICPPQLPAACAATASSPGCPLPHLAPLSPPPAVRSQVDHFVSFADDERVAPVVWHQTLLCFVQRYKDEVRSEDREALRKLCTVQKHYQVGGCVGGGEPPGRAAGLYLPVLPCRGGGEYLPGSHLPVPTLPTCLPSPAHLPACFLLLPLP